MKEELLGLVTDGFDYSRLKQAIDRSHADRKLVRSTYPAFQPKWDFDPGDGTAGNYARTRLEEEDSPPRWNSRSIPRGKLRHRDAEKRG